MQLSLFQKLIVGLDVVKKYDATGESFLSVFCDENLCKGVVPRIFTRQIKIHMRKFLYEQNSSLVEKIYPLALLYSAEVHDIKSVWGKCGRIR